MAAIDSLGFVNTYDFCFVPIDTDSNNCKGYGFVNFLDVEDAALFCKAVEGYRFSRSGTSNKRAEVSVAHTQGVVATLERMRPWKKKNRQKFASESRGRPFVKQGRVMVAMRAEDALAMFTLRRDPSGAPF